MCSKALISCKPITASLTRFASSSWSSTPSSLGSLFWVPHCHASDHTTAHLSSHPFTILSILRIAQAACPPDRSSRFKLTYWSYSTGGVLSYHLTSACFDCQARTHQYHLGATKRNGHAWMNDQQQNCTQVHLWLESPSWSWSVTYLP